MPTPAEEIVNELFNSEEGRRDPYPLYHRLRELAPVHYDPAMGFWILTRYADCAAMLRDPRFGKNYTRQMEDLIGPHWVHHPAVAGREDSMLNVDGPGHTRLRRAVVKSFQRQAIDDVRPMIQKIVGELVDRVPEGETCDILTEVGFPLPVGVIGEMLGVPASDRAPFRALVLDVTAVFEVKPSLAQLEQADASYLTMRDYFDRLIAEKCRQPGQDLLSLLANEKNEEDRLDPDEITTLAGLLFGAGFETTTNLFGNTLTGLLHQPDQLGLLHEQPDLFAKFPDEALRYDGTVQMLSRYAKTDVQFGDATIPEGALVMAVLAAGNRDPEKFEHPDEIDLERPKFRPLALGGGEHFCLGAQLAKAEIETTFRTLLGRFGTIELVEEPRFRDRLTLRGVESLQVCCREETPAVHRAPAARATAQRREEPTAEAAIQGARPMGEGDAQWRNDLRAKIETDAATGGVPWLQTGAELASTIVLLARADLFRPCKPDDIAELAATAYPMSFEPGDRLCVEGGESLECYVIAEGEAEVTIDGRTVSMVRENDVVGERGPLEERVRTATVTATTEMITYAISRERLHALVQENPDAAEGMLAYIRNRYPDA